MLRQTYRWNWPITLYMQVVILYCIIKGCFAQYTSTKQPMHAVVTEGQTASIKCEWKPDLDPGYNLRWVFFKRIKVKIVEEGPNTKYILSSKSNSSTLLIPSFSGSDVGAYRCEIAGPNIVSISELAEVFELTCNPKTDEGELGSIPACYSTSDKVELQWFKNGEPVGLKKRSLISTMPLSKEDDGVEFTCRATSDSLEIGNCTTTPLILQIRAWIRKSPPGPIQVGDKFNLTCSVNGDPERYDFHWMLRSRIVYGSTKEKENIFAFSEVVSNYNGTNASCTVSRTNRNSTVAFFIIELSTITIPTTPNDNVDATSSFSEMITTCQDKSSNLLSVVAINLAIFISISIIFIVIYHKKIRIIDLITRKTSNRSSDKNAAEYDDVALPSTCSGEKSTEDNGEPHTSQKGYSNIVELNTLYGHT